MKLAIVHDDITRRGGGEQVALSFHRAFPDAPIYTLSYCEEATYPEFRACTIKTSWFGRYVKKEQHVKRFFFPFGVWAMKQLHLKGYDVVLQSTTHCAKYVKTDPRTLVLTYCHTPFRLVWRPESYDHVVAAGRLSRIFYKWVLTYLRKIDRESAQRTDWFITNAREVVPRIQSAYPPLKDISIIHPPVRCRNFHLSSEVGDYYLMVSRLEAYKKVDLVIETFNELPEKKLIIVGKGSREQELKAMAKGNITFLSGISTDRLAVLYAECRALVFPQLEDYGITPLEANASGRPVIAYGKGGVTDTMIPLTGDNALKATAIFFEEQNKRSLLKALDRFEKATFDSRFIRSHAESFDEERFIRLIRDFVHKKFRLHFPAPVTAIKRAQYEYIDN